ncbi:polyamine aminopropyltransferase [Nevskia ramosa]|uniref:polyamine aminopropyltransferase n=1 Tax=Nevskia ramosa TaxID=64002 RepID=UPI003D10C3B6
MTAAVTPLPLEQAAPSAAEVALLASVFVIAACGLVYELAAGTLASYVLGDSVLQFSTIIGTYLFAMGIGSWLSRYIERQLAAQFLRIELLVGVVGGLMPAILFTANAVAPSPFRGLLYGLVLLVGVLVGLEIPLVMRLLRRQYALKHLVSQVLTFDYLGALGVSIAFPLLLVPKLGLIRTSLLFGMMNVGVAAWALWLYRGELRLLRAHLIALLLSFAVLLAAFIGADRITRWSEDRYYTDPVLYAASSPYQRIIITQARSGHAETTRLWLNGNLQFHARDEYRYHESLVHPLIASLKPRRVLILGGGDGMAAREVLKHAQVESITLVDLDPQITRLFSTQPLLRRLNADALHSSKLQVINADAFQWLQARIDTPGSEPFDAVIIDFPDPSNFSLGKLYTNSFYSLVEQNLSASGQMVVQTTSPLIARKSFWTVVATLESLGLKTAPYHALVPSFGEWGFVIAGRRSYVLPEALPEGLRFLEAATLPRLFEFPPDMSRVPAEPNRLSNQVLVQTFDAEWGVMENDY